MRLLGMQEVQISGRGSTHVREGTGRKQTGNVDELSLNHAPAVRQADGLARLHAYRQQDSNLREAGM